MLPALVFLLATYAQVSRPAPLLPVRTAKAVANYRPAKECASMTDPVVTNSPRPAIRRGYAKLDLIVGFDGRIYSAYFMETSLDSKEQDRILKVLGAWRYHPATCNGVPVDAEGLVLFRRR
jgi:hypothetical protein